MRTSSSIGPKSLSGDGGSVLSAEELMQVCVSTFSFELLFLLLMILLGAVNFMEHLIFRRLTLQMPMLLKQTK